MPALSGDEERGDEPRVGEPASDGDGGGASERLAEEWLRPTLGLGASVDSDSGVEVGAGDDVVPVGGGGPGGGPRRRVAREPKTIGVIETRIESCKKSQDGERVERRGRGMREKELLLLAVLLANEATAKPNAERAEADRQCGLEDEPRDFVVADGAARVRRRQWLARAVEAHEVQHQTVARQGRRTIPLCTCKRSKRTEAHHSKLWRVVVVMDSLGDTAILCMPTGEGKESSKCKETATERVVRAYLHSHRTRGCSVARRAMLA